MADRDETRVIPIFGTNAMRDMVFFRKEDICPGVDLAYHGRTDPGSKWRVMAVYRYSVQNGVLRRRRVERVETLHDEIVLQRIGANSASRRAPLGNEFRPTFVYLSYSALWRII